MPALGSSNYAQVSVFGVEGKGNKFVYVFDRSASMEGPPLAAAKKSTEKAAAARPLRTLPA